MYKTSHDSHTKTTKNITNLPPPPLNRRCLSQTFSGSSQDCRRLLMLAFATRMKRSARFMFSAVTGRLDPRPARRTGEVAATTSCRARTHKNKNKINNHMDRIAFIQYSISEILHINMHPLIAFKMIRSTPQVSIVYRMYFTWTRFPSGLASSCVDHGLL